MTETTVLTICFICTFGFIGCKIFKLVREVLQKYSQKIENDINESERLKMKAINLLEEAVRKDKSISTEIEKRNQLTDEKMHQIKKNFDKKLDRMLKNITENSNKRIEFEKNILIEQFKYEVRTTISSVVKEYVDNITEEEKDNAMMKTLLKVDFKKLINNS